MVEASGLVTIHRIVRSEAAVTARIAVLQAPPDAREMRRKMLAARRRIDAITIRAYRVMSRSSDPVAAYNRIGPAIHRRIIGMYDTFGSFGVDCSTAA
jgi:hypothetical protein